MKRLSLLASIFIFLLTAACGTDQDVAPIDQQPDAGLDASEDAKTDSDTSNTDETPEEDTDPPGPPQLDYSPHQISFRPVELEASDTARVTVRNLGESPLFLSDVQIHEFGELDHPSFSRGEVWPELPLIIEPSTYRDFALVYAPQSYGTHRGELILFSDDPDNIRVPIRIETLSAYPEIDAPHRLNLGTVFPSEPTTTRVEVFNRGATPLQIDNITLAHEPGGPQNVFTIEVLGQGPPYELRRDHFIYVDITTTPSGDERVEGEVLIESNDPARPQAKIALLANGPAPCLRTSGDIDFGEVRTGRSATTPLTLLNCSASSPLLISALEITDDAGQIFSFVTPPATPIEIAPRQTEKIPLQVQMHAPDEVVGTLTISTNDPHNPEVLLHLRVRPPREE